MTYKTGLGYRLTHLYYFSQIIGSRISRGLRKWVSKINVNLAVTPVKRCVAWFTVILRFCCTDESVLLGNASFLGKFIYHIWLCKLILEKILRTTFYHGMCAIAVATSCCISEELCQWEKANCDTQSSKIYSPIVLELKFKKRSAGRPAYQIWLRSEQQTS